MFTPNTENDGVIHVNPVQISPHRLSIYGIDRCQDQVIGFEFVTNEYSSDPKCFGNILINLCVPVEVLSELVIDSAEFVATDDPCFKEFIIDIKESPQITLQRNIDNNVTGVIVHFYKQDTCCYPNQMAFQLWGTTEEGCRSIIARGLLYFR